MVIFRSSVLRSNIDCFNGLLNYFVGMLFAEANFSVIKILAGFFAFFFLGFSFLFNSFSFSLDVGRKRGYEQAMKLLTSLYFAGVWLSSFGSSNFVVI